MASKVVGKDRIQGGGREDVKKYEGGRESECVRVREALDQQQSAGGISHTGDGGVREGGGGGANAGGGRGNYKMIVDHMDDDESHIHVMNSDEMNVNDLNHNEVEDDGMKVHSYQKTAPKSSDSCRSFPIFVLFGFVFQPNRRAYASHRPNPRLFFAAGLFFF